MEPVASGQSVSLYLLHLTADCLIISASYLNIKRKPIKHNILVAAGGNV